MNRKAEEFFRINHLPPYLLGEIARAVIDARLAGKDIVDLSQFNPNLNPPAAAVDRLVQASLQPHNHRYSSSQGITRLREAIAQWYARRFGVTVDPEREAVVTIGTKEGLSHFLFAVLSAGDAVLLPTPSYPIHNAAAVLAGAGVIGVPLVGRDSTAYPELLTEHDDGFFKRLVTAYERTWPRPILMLLSFPHNPTTVSVTPGFFSRLVDVARERGFYLVHDFAYAELTYDGYKAPSILAAPGAEEVAVEFVSLSKGLNIPGWRIGFCVGNPVLVAALKKIKSYLDCGIFQPLQIAAARALDQSEGIAAENCEVYRARRNVLVDGLNRSGWEVRKPCGTVFVWGKIPERFRALGSLACTRQLLDEAQVAACPGVGFDPRADEYVRFALSEPEKRLRVAIQRMDEGVVHEDGASVERGSGITELPNVQASANGSAGDAAAGGDGKMAEQGAGGGR